MPVNRRVCGADLPQGEVVRPTGQQQSTSAIRIKPHLGGGTILAERWRRCRRSTDIDITLPDDPGPGDLTRDDGNNLTRRLDRRADPENQNEIRVQSHDGALHLVSRLASSMQNSSPFRPRENAIDPGKV